MLKYELLLVHIEEYRLKLVIAVEDFDPDKGYLEYYLARELARLGHKVCIITFAKGKSSIGAMVKEDFRIISIPHIAAISGYHVPTLTGIASIVKHIRAEKPDIVHCQPLSSPLSLLLISLRRLYDYRIVGSLVTQEFSTESTTKAIMFSLLKAFTRRYIISRSDLIFAKTRGLANALVKWFDVKSSRLMIIPLGADPELFRFDCGARKRVREILGLRADDVVILYSGKINSSKDLDVLIKASAPIVAQHERVKLLIIGKGESSYIDYLKDLISELEISGKVILYPWVHRTKLPDFYSASDIAVWPGISSISIVEAASVGLPIIMRESSVEAYGIENDNGLTFKRGSIGELRNRLEVLVNDDKLRQQMGRRSRLLVERKLNWVSIAVQYMEAYQQVLDERIIQESKLGSQTS